MLRKRRHIVFAAASRSELRFHHQQSFGKMERKMDSPDYYVRAWSLLAVLIEKGDSHTVCVCLKIVPGLPKMGNGKILNNECQ